MRTIKIKQENLEVKEKVIQIYEKTITKYENSTKIDAQKDLLEKERM